MKRDRGEGVDIHTFMMDHVHQRKELGMVQKAMCPIKPGVIDQQNHEKTTDTQPGAMRRKISIYFGVPFCTQVSDHAAEKCADDEYEDGIRELRLDLFPVGPFLQLYPPVPESRLVFFPKNEVSKGCQSAV